LLYLMGSKSLVGASAAIVLGLIIYKGYGVRRVESQITPWETAKMMFTDADEVERRRLFAAFYEADSEGEGNLDLDKFVYAFKSLGYIEGGGPNIPDDAIVLSKTRNRRGNQLIGDVFSKGDADKDGLISIQEFLEVAQEIEPEV
jgi:Ca2+-binding EF-hand superfamily protein